MPKAIKICKVCGAEYEYCHTVRRVANVFRWQDVACCPDHGSIYFDRIVASRSKPDTDLAEVAPVSVPSNDDTSDRDDLFEEDFDDSDEELAIETK